jgi:hypothetical protein
MRTLSQLIARAVPMCAAAGSRGAHGGGASDALVATWATAAAAAAAGSIKVHQLAIGAEHLHVVPLREASVATYATVDWRAAQQVAVSDSRMQ